MQKAYTVTQAYQNSNPDPIVLKSGDEVSVGERSQADGPWPNWVYCVSDRTQKAGWTPIQILQISGEIGIATTDYTAKEMTVEVGDLVLGDNELNGWLWCVRESDGQTGWVPQECLV